VTTVFRDNESSRTRESARGFTLVDVLATSVVIAILIGILVPALGGVQQTARRVVCQSNVRQIGLGVVLYADAHGGRLPASQFLPQSPSQNRAAPQPQNMLTLRISPGQLDSGGMDWDGMDWDGMGWDGMGWDGIGLLYSTDYLPAPKIFFCPSHRGDHSYSKMVRVWNDPSEELVGNYHFRGAGPIARTAGPVTRTFDLYRIDPGQSSLIADGMREISDYNHKIGSNFFRADLTVHWFSDLEGRLNLAESKELSTPEIVNDAWHLFDDAAGVGTLIH
jgi:type II secretory pathway pseudopilin PulG